MTITLDEIERSPWNRRISLQHVKSYVEGAIELYETLVMLEDQGYEAAVFPSRGTTPFKDLTWIVHRSEFVARRGSNRWQHDLNRPFGYRTISLPFTADAPEDVFESLAAKVTKAEYAPRPEFGEEQIEVLVRGIGSMGAAQTHPIRRFFQGIEGAEQYVAKHLGDIIHNRSLPAKPQLTTLVAVATHFGVDTLQLIVDPSQAARQATLDIKLPPKTRVARPSSHVRQKRTAWFKAKLELAIQSGPPFPSSEEFCRNNDFSISAARGTFRDLTTTLSEKHLKWKRSKANKLRERAIAAIAARADTRAQLTIKELVAQVCAASGAPIHMVRGLVDCNSDGL